jgi:hypothetical protein
VQKTACELSVTDRMTFRILKILPTSLEYKVSVMTHEIPHSNKITHMYIGTEDYEAEKQVFRSLSANCFNFLKKKLRSVASLQVNMILLRKGCDNI